MTSYSPIFAPPRFCSHCGGALRERLLDADDRPRLVCDRCQHIHYLDPKVVVGVIIERGGRVPRLADYDSSLFYSVNAEYVPPDYALRDGDEVAFIPPVSGGCGAD